MNINEIPNANKMKKLLMMFLCIGFVVNICAQDLVVTNANDSLNCKIAKVTLDKIHFIFKQNLEIKNTVLSSKQIKSYAYNFYPTPAVSKDILTNMFSQDLIVTNADDSLVCKINQITHDRVYFTFRNNSEMKNTFLAPNQIKTYEYNYYHNIDVPEDIIVSKQIYPRVRFSFNGGWSYQTSKIEDNLSSDMKEYTQGLQSGYHLGGDITCFVTEPIGIGFKYLLFKSSNSIENVDIDIKDGPHGFGSMSDNIAITFFGPSFNLRLLSSNKRNALLFGLSIGYLGFKDKSTILNNDLTMTGSTIGIVYDLGYDIGISEIMSLGFNIALLRGTLNEYELSNGSKTQTTHLDKDPYLGLGHIDLSIGLKINL